LASLFDRRLLAFSGKGGAGKSTATAAFAVAAARAGKRVLVVEIGEHERISRLFGAPPVGYSGAIVYRPGAAGAPPVTAMCITASEALREYGMRTVRFETLYNAVFDNPVVRYFSAAAPAVQELNILGKIESLHRESIDPAPGARFDLMLLDAPATGHAVALFESPRLAMRLAQAGPIHAMVERVWRLVTDPVRTALNIVSLPQDVVVNESLEFAARIRALGIPPGVVVVNGVYPDAFSQDEIDRATAGAAVSHSPLADTVVDAARSITARRREQESMMARLADGIPGPQVILPLLAAGRIGRAEIEALAEHVAAGLANE
jgi:anion-transporting  ArsA/GET3 family ATPase